MVLTTRDLALAAKVSEQAVRDYEAGGLLPPVPRRQNGYRAFSAMHLAALIVVRALKEAGYARAEMMIVMDAMHRGSLSMALALIDDHHGTLRERRASLARAERDQSVTHADPNSGVARREVTLSIGEAARRLDMRTSTLRLWESLGVIRVERDPSNGYRRFGEADLARIAAIKRMRELGVPWDAIREAVHVPPADSCEDGQGSASGIFREIDRQSWLNVRATTLACAYCTVCQGAGEDADDDLLRPFLDSLAALHQERLRSSAHDTAA